MFPITSNASPGLSVPIPTFPSPRMYSLEPAEFWKSAIPLSVAEVLCWTTKAVSFWSLAFSINNAG